MTERFAAAVVGQPFALEGRVKLKTLSGETAHLLKLKHAVLRHVREGGREEKLDIEDMHSGGFGADAAPVLLVKFRGIDSPEAAKRLAGAELLVDRADAAPLAEGEFYIEDLKGLEVWCGAGAVGKIADVVEGGGGFLAEVKLKSGGTRLVPFRDEFFGEIDVEAGRAQLLNEWILD